MRNTRSRDRLSTSRHGSRKHVAGCSGDGNYLCGIEVSGRRYYRPQWRPVEGTDLRVLVPGGQSRGASIIQIAAPYWAAASEEAFSPTNARQKWIDNLDWAKRNGLMAGLVIHPWMLVVNPGEVQVVKDYNPLR